MSTEDDLHQAAHHVHNDSLRRAVGLLVKVVAVLAVEIAELKKERHPHHQSEPERDVG